MPLITEVRGRILGSRDRSKSQQVVSNPRNTCSIGMWLRAKSRLSGVPIRAGAGQSAKVCYRELPRIPLLRTPLNKGHQGAATGFGENLHDHEHLVAHAGLLPLLLSAIPKDESLEALPHILVFPDERRVGLAGGPITHPIAADEARAPTLSCSPRSTTVRRP